MIPRQRVLDKLDGLLQRNDYAGARRLLEYWHSEARATGDGEGALLMENELMGLCRKLALKEAAMDYAQRALATVKALGIEENVGAATTYLNSATVYKAFGLPQQGLELYRQAREIYESALSPQDSRLGGLYNNMALALVDLGQFRQAEALYEKALAVMGANAGTEPEQAITWLNMATAVEQELGLEPGRERIEELAKKAMELLEQGKDRPDGNYAFVCEKCAPVFGHYGFADYREQLQQRCRRIYEGT